MPTNRFRQAVALLLATLVGTALVSPGFAQSPSTVRFQDISRTAGTDALANGYGVAFGDPDGNGCRDLFVHSHFVHPSRLYLNDCQGRFVDHLPRLATALRFEITRSGSAEPVPALLEPA